MRICKESWDVAPTPTVVGLKPLPRLTKLVIRLITAEAATALLTPCVVVTLPAGIVLVAAPAVPPGVITSTLTVHEVAAVPPARLPPPRLTELAPATAVTVPPQVVVADGGVAMT